MELNENRWTVDAVNDFAHWFIYSKSLQEEAGYSELVSLLKMVFYNGQSSQILTLNTAFSEDFLLSDILKEKTCGNNTICDLNKIPVSNMIWVYKGNEIQSVEFTCDSMEFLLKQLHHPMAEKLNFFSFMPLTLSLSVAANKSFALGIHLKSDIFFPYVCCPWKWNEKYDDNGEIGPGVAEINYKKHGFDNQKLATLNSDRLNHFIAAIKTYADSNKNLIWDHYSTEHWLGYHKMVDESGIKLLNQNM